MLQNCSTACWVRTIDGQTGGPARPGPVPAWPGLHRPGLLIVPGRAARQADLSAQA
jgi:hypothetical protein